MLDKLFRLLTKQRDTLVFQISEEFVEVVALRQDEESVKELGNACITDTLYTKREPISKPTNKKVLDDLESQIQTLIDSTTSSAELVSDKFNLARAKVVCVFVEPLSYKTYIKYKAESKKPLKITNKLLQSILVDERVISNTLQDAPKDYAVYSDELVEVELNGYNTTKPLRRYAKEVLITVEKYLIDPKLWSAVGKVLERSFNRDIQYIHMPEVVDISTTAFCNEIYTVSELQTISNDIL